MHECVCVNVLCAMRECKYHLCERSSGVFNYVMFIRKKEKTFKNVLRKKKYLYIFRNNKHLTYNSNGKYWRVYQEYNILPNDWVFCKQNNSYVGCKWYFFI